MPSIKIYPPTPPPDRNVNETQFNIWTEEIEVYLSQEKDFAIFLPGALIIAKNNLTARQSEEQNIKRLAKRQRDLRTVLSIITPRH